MASADLAALAAFSPAVARILAGRPTYARFVRRAPSWVALARVPLVAARVRRALRLLRARVLVHTTSAELSGTSPLVTGRIWSDAADAAITLGARMAAHETEAKLGAPVLDDGTGVGRAVLALGKLGSRELNPSSDVDLLVVYSADGGLASGSSAHEWHVMFARRLRALLSDVDDDGFAFRVDCDLRPEGTAGPLANSLDALESYYERFGQTWERAALLRLRAVVDVPGTMGADIERRLRPFVFPRTVDERAVDELFAMKQRVTASAGGDDDGFDVKRGHGGIREVEFIAQANQLLHGGKLADLRRGSTVEILERLEAHGLLPHKTTLELIDGYVLLRRVEHALQYGEDRQTQLLPRAGNERARVALGLGPSKPVGAVDAEAVARALTSLDTHLDSVRARVHAAFERLLGEGRDQPSTEARRALDRTNSDDERAMSLTALGFVDGARALQLVRVLERRRGSPLAPDVTRGAGALDAGAHLIDHVAKSPDPMTALARLPDLFLERVPRAALTRVATDRRTLALAARLLATSAPLSRMLARHHGLDQILARTSSTFTRPRRAHVAADLRAEIAAAVDDEARLVAMRRVHSRRTLAIALAFFAGRVDVGLASLSLSSLADGLLDHAVTFAHDKIRARHGSIPGQRFAVIALGSLGGRELGFFRDLDLLFVYDTNATDGADRDVLSTGPRAIGAAEHAARTAQQVIWALSAPLAEGACYAVDPRLRPSGSQGALTTSLATFVDYHARASAPWERQALLRARFVAGDASLGHAAVAAAKRAALGPAPAGLGARLLDMRARMVAERASTAGLDLKMGDGGIADVEFAVQGLELAHGARDPSVWCPSTRRGLRHLAKKGLVTVDVARALEESLVTLVRAREALALVDDKREPAVTHNDARLDLLARAGVLDGVDGAAVYESLARAAATVREHAGRVMLRLG